MKNFIIILIFLLSKSNLIYPQQKEDKKQFKDDFNLESCTLLSTGRNTYFILEPGYFLKLRGIDKGDTAQLIVTVLNETKMVGNVECRVVEENESVNGRQIEISKNYFAFCKETGDIYYFGEDVDIYKKGKIVSHSGGWLAEGNNKPGLIMPGTYEIGYKYHQEIAPDVAMDRAEIISISETLITSAGNFTNCLKTEETTPLEPKEKEFKYYAPGIGLIKEENLLLVEYGSVK
jgi:hypothetical protein